MDSDLTDTEIERGFNEWLRQYTADPNAFEDIVAAVLEAQRQRNDGKPLTYGQACLATLRRMARA